MRMRYLLLILNVFILLPCRGQVYELLPAEPYGGKYQLKQFISETMYYPDQARKNKIQGTVAIAFHVNADGTVEHARVRHSLSPEADAEAMRLFRYLLWKPASARGASVDSEAKLEIDFKLRKYKRCVRQRGYDSLEYPYRPVDTSLRVYLSRQLDKSPSPVYDDGSKSFAEFILRNMKYPDAAVKQGISGTVELFFVIEPWGRISNVRVLEGVGAGCSEEAVRLLRLFRWMPGIKEGKAVRTEMQLSITFNLSDFEKHRYVPASNNNQI